MGGCAGHPKSAVASTQPGGGPSRQAAVTLSVHAQNPGAEKVPWQALIRLDIYHFNVPVGGISQNAGLWAHANENCVSEATKQRLHANGLRCGTAVKSDWDYFRDVLRSQPVSAKRMIINGVDGQGCELELTKAVEAEDLFVYSGEGQPQGRSYEACVNRVDLSFVPIPDRPFTVHLALCPTVVGKFSRMQFTPTNEVLESHYTAPTRIYDVGLTVDLDGDHFFVVGPGEGAGVSTTVGNRFFTMEEDGQRVEQLLVIIPTFLPLDGRPVTISKNLISP